MYKSERQPCFMPKWGRNRFPVELAALSGSVLWASHRAGIYRQRTEENVLKAQLVNFYRLTKS